METFGDVVIRILYTIIDGIIGTAVSVARDVILLFSTIGNNMGSLSYISIIIAVILLGLIMFGIFMLLKGQIKPLVIAVAVLILIMLVLTML